MLLSAIALYSSGPVTPSIRNVPVPSWWPERAPQPGGLPPAVEPGLPLELLVAGGVHVADGRVGDVRVDVERGGAGRPVAGALLAADGAPREGGAAQAELAGPLRGAGRVLCRQRSAWAAASGHGVGQHRQHERLGVPERVAVVAGPGQALGRDGPALGPGAGLQHVEQAEPDRLLDLLVAVEFHVGPAQKSSRYARCSAHRRVPAGLPGRGQRACHLVAQGGPGAGAGPAVADELHQPQRLAGSSRPLTVSRARSGRLSVHWCAVASQATCVVHGGRHGQVALPGPVHQQRPGRRPRRAPAAPAAPPAPPRPAGRRRRAAAPRWRPARTARTTRTGPSSDSTS